MMSPWSGVRHSGRASATGERARTATGKPAWAGIDLGPETMGLAHVYNRPLIKHLQLLG